jgi:hypothetical protein
MNVFSVAAQKNLPTGQVADEMARDIIANGGKS